MERKKVIFSLIQSLTPDEKLVFRKKIPGSNSSKTYARLLALYDFFEKLSAKENSADAIQMQDLIKVLDLGSYKKLYPYFDILIEDLEDFVVKKEIAEQSLEREAILQNALIKRGNLDYIEWLHTRVQEHIYTTPTPSVEEYLNRAYFYDNLYTHISTNTYESDALLHLHQSENNLDIFYWIQKICLLIEKANRALIFSNEEFLFKELPILPDLTPYIQHNKAHLLNIYTCVYQFVLAPFQSEDLDIAIALINSAPSIPKEDRERILNYLNNIILYYIAHKDANKCNLSPKDIYKVYKLSFSNLWLVQKDGKMLFEDFINILYLAFHNKDFNFLKSISDDYKEYTPLDCISFINTLSKGYIFFLYQKWAAIIKIFSNQGAPPKSYRLYYTMQRNVLEIKALYESIIQDKKELEDIPNVLEKHLKFVQREFKLNDIGKDRNLNFIKLLKKIYPYLAKRIDFKFDKKVVEKEISEWIAEVEANKGQTIELEWLQSVGERLLAEVQKKKVLHK